MREVSIIAAVFIGIFAGWIAEQLTGREHGLLTNLLVGMLGAFIGVIAANVLGIGFAGFWGSLAVSTVGAVILLGISGLIHNRKML